MEIKIKVKILLFFLFIFQVINVDGQNYIQTTTSNPGTIDIVHDGNIDAKNLLIYRGGISSTTLDSMRTIGLYRVEYAGSHSEALLDVNGIPGSTPRFQLKANYDESLYFRAARDNEVNWDNKGFREIIMADENGNVGIGTRNPVERLSLFSSSNDIASFRRTNWNNTDRFKFTVSGNPTNEHLNFVWNSGSDNYLLSILSSGKVGVGTTSPEAKLEINGAPSLTSNALTVSKSFIGGGDNCYTASIIATDSGISETGIKIGKKGSSSLASSDAYPLEVVSNGATKAVFTGTGNVGIGTNHPAAGLHVVKVNNYNGNRIAAILGNQYNDWTYFGGLTAGRIRGDDAGYLVVDSNPNGTGNKRLYLNLESPGDVIVANGGGNVGIGTVSPGYKLDVIGAIRAQEIKVDLNGADFVFENNYKLRPLTDIEEYVKENKHLPGIESASEMETDGTNLGDLNTKLLQKVEELTLYTIAQQKEIDELKKQIFLIREQKSNSSGE